MMATRDRAYRRAKQLLKKRKVSRYWAAGYWFHKPLPVTDKTAIGRTATTPKPCGCALCSRQRRAFGPRFAELRDRLATDVALALTELP